MNISNLIQNINTIKTNASINVCDAIISMINKNELINEYSENTELSEIVIESMMLFMESKNQKRDKTPRNEISKWMEEKGYWYTGDNPKKKKECMRMYHFLQQHKFDPKDGTYESDIKLKNGSNKRIKLNIDEKPLSPEERNKWNSIVKNYRDSKTGKLNVDDMPADIYKNYLNIAYKLADNSLLKTGNNAFYSSDGDISIGSKTLKGKQYDSQFTLKHEEGHADSYNKGEGGYRKKKDNQIKDGKYKSKDEQIKIESQDDKDVIAARKYLDKQVESGKYINKHDNSAEEVTADKYAATHERIRTTGAGTNHSIQTRKAKLSDIQKAYENMSRSITKHTSELNNQKDYFNKTIKECNNNILTNNGYINEFKNFDMTNTKHLNDLRDVMQQMTDDKTYKNISALQAAIENVTESRKTISELKIELSNIDDKSSKEYNKIEKEIADEEDWLSDSLKSLKSKQKRIRSTYQQTSISPMKIMNIKRIIERTQSSIRRNKEINHSDTDKKSIEEFIKGHLIPFLEQDNKTQTDIKQTCEESLNNLGKAIDSSTQVRFDFVKKYIKEYFEQLYDDYSIFND